MQTSRIDSVNVGQPREVPWRGSMGSTAIFKEPLDGRIRVAGLNMDALRRAMGVDALLEDLRAALAGALEVPAR